MTSAFFMRQWRTDFGANVRGCRSRCWRARRRTRDYVTPCKISELRLLPRTRTCRHGKWSLPTRAKRTLGRPSCTSSSIPIFTSSGVSVAALSIAAILISLSRRLLFGSMAECRRAEACMARSQAACAATLRVASFMALNVSRLRRFPRFELFLLMVVVSGLIGPGKDVCDTRIIRSSSSRSAMSLRNPNLRAAVACPWRCRPACNNHRINEL